MLCLAAKPDFVTGSTGTVTLAELLTKNRLNKTTKNKQTSSHAQPQGVTILQT